MGPRAGLDRCGKSRLPPGFDSRTDQLVASRYTDSDMPAHIIIIIIIIIIIMFKLLLETGRKRLGLLDLLCSG